MKLVASKIIKLLIIYLYGAFVLNVIDIFYLNRVISGQGLGYILTSILPLFLLILFARKDFPLTKKMMLWHAFSLVIVCPFIFFFHIALAL